MPRLKRVKTKYIGVYYVMGRSKIEYGKPERIYYIRYRRNGKEIEEKVGRQFQDAMTPSEAAKIRAECIDCKRLPLKERRKQEGEKKAQTQSGSNVPGDFMIKTEPISSKDGSLISKEFYETLFENANDMVLYLNREGFITHANKKAEEIFGVKVNDIIGKHYNDSMGYSFPKGTVEKAMALSEQVLSRDQVKGTVEFDGLYSDGTPFSVEVTLIPVKEDENTSGLLAIARDISKRKEAELRLKATYNEMESKVTRRTSNLEQANIALKVLLKRREDDKVDLEEKMIMNIKELVLPYLAEMKNGGLKENQAFLADVMENNLNDIISSFTKTLSSQHYNLTLTEIRIANLIKQGRSTKEIAEHLKTSSRTIDNHRFRIRKKLGISKKKTNLAAYLLTLNSPAS